MRTLKFINKSPHEDIDYEYGTDSGFDLRAWIREGDMISQEIPLFGKVPEIGRRYIKLIPFERRLISTGLYLNIPEGCEVQVRPRSGEALKKGLTVINTPGTIDCGYGGEIKVIVVNLSDKHIEIEDGERIAQAVVCPVYSGNDIFLKKVGGFRKDENERGTNGFGSTGTK